MTAAALAAQVAELLIERHLHLGVAESCTGGRLADALTNVPGSSAFFIGGVVAYANEVKEALLGIDRALLVAHGAVSEPVARAMARGARQLFQSDLGLAVTGIAGPTGGTPQKPVGLGYIAVAGPAGERCTCFQGPGDREENKQRFTEAALRLLREFLGQDNALWPL